MKRNVPNPQPALAAARPDHFLYWRDLYLCRYAGRGGAGDTSP